MALKNHVGAQSTYNDFEKIGYPYYESSYGERYSSHKLIIFQEQIDFYLLYSQCIMAIIVN